MHTLNQYHLYPERAYSSGNLVIETQVSLCSRQICDEIGTFCDRNYWRQCFSRWYKQYTSSADMSTDMMRSCIHNLFLFSHDNIIPLITYYHMFCGRLQLQWLENSRKIADFDYECPLNFCDTRRKPWKWDFTVYESGHVWVYLELIELSSWRFLKQGTKRGAWNNYCLRPTRKKFAFTVQISPQPHDIQSAGW